jgi:hypothetical protein
MAPCDGRERSTMERAGQRREDGFARSVNDHLSDDETVAKIGRPNFMGQTWAHGM